jgi:hypothetical protein
MDLSTKNPVRKLFVKLLCAQIMLLTKSGIVRIQIFRPEGRNLSDNIFYKNKGRPGHPGQPSFLLFFFFCGIGYLWNW